jgi:hypothetical protein
MQPQPVRHPQRWRTVEELLECGYQRSRVIMINECHAGWFRCIRTRRIGQRLLPMAHHLGVRHLAHGSTLGARRRRGQRLKASTAKRRGLPGPTRDASVCSVRP